MVDNAEGTLTLEQLAELREKTEATSQFLQTQLRAHLETLRPLFAPRRLLGKYVRSALKEDVAGAERALAQLQELYAEVCEKPFGLVPELEDSALERLDNRLELYPWEYLYEAKAAKETKTVTITAPVRWVLCYGSEYSLAQLRQVLAGREERRSDDIRQFVVNALVMHLVLGKYSGIAQLLADLRYDVQTEQLADLGELPVVSVSSCVPSFRPPDDLIVAATRFSGVPAFIELIDANAVQNLPDPLRVKIETILR